MYKFSFAKTGLPRSSIATRLPVLVCFTGIVLYLSSCAVNIADYKGKKPVLDLQEFFQGELTAWGIFQSRNGEVKNHFKVSILANWNNDVCRLEEEFEFSDGKKQNRVWTIVKTGKHRYSGSADDVIGTAEGIAYGNALNWRYTLELPVDDTTYRVQFDDWMYLVDDEVLINRAEVSKFGFRVGEVTIFFRKTG